MHSCEVADCPNEAWKSGSSMLHAHPCWRSGGMPPTSSQENFGI